MIPNFDISCFEYSPNYRTFRIKNGPIHDIVPSSVEYGKVIYKSNRTYNEIPSKKFVIRNTETNGFREFVMSWENNEYMYFTSEDNLVCLIIK